jgi:hypothetical protein
MIRRHKTNWLLVLLLNLLFVSNYIKLCEAIRKHESIDNYEVTDANKLDTEKEVGKTSFFTVTDKINRRKTDKSTKFRKYQWMQKEVDLITQTSNKHDDVECHKAAVWKCGHVFIRAHKFLDYIGIEESFEPKCALRTAFFSCLKISKNKFCHKHKSPHTEKFRKRLADTLWSTRACLLGVKTN